MFTHVIDYRLISLNTALFFLLIIGAGGSLAQNIVSNSGFEIGKVFARLTDAKGFRGKMPEEWYDQKEGGAEGRVILTDKEAHSGKRCLFIEHKNDDGYIHPNKKIKIEPGDYTFCFWAKSDKEIEFSVELYCETDWSVLVGESCNLKSNIWTRFEFPASFLKTFPGSIQIGLRVKGRLWLDDVELIIRKEVKKIANIQLWDTLSPFPDQVNVWDKTNWQLVPAGTGGVYSSKGDIVLENDYLTVVFCSERGKVIVYSKSGKKRMELIPLQLKGKTANITSCKIFSRDDKATIEACFSAKEMEKNLFAIFSFSKEQIIEVKYAENMRGISLFSPIEFGILPNFISDDLIFDPKDYNSGETLYIPSENLFLGLLKGEDSMLVITWPKGKQEMRLILDKGRLVESEDGFTDVNHVDFENDGKSVYLAILDAPGIWHKEELKSSYLEKDVAVDWKKPFPAKWITQLYEDEVKTTYTFKESEPKTEDFWRAGIGWYTYPVWFARASPLEPQKNEGEKAFYHLGKKVPPKGESIIYFLERKGTPGLVSAPVDVMKRTLDNQTYESILDFEGRSHRNLTRPNFVVDTATCGVTDRLKPIFEAGKEVEKKEYVKGGIEDMLYFLAKERERAFEYQNFAHEMIEFLTLMKREKPKSKLFLDKMNDITKEIIAAYEHEKENIKDAEYAEKLAKETEALTQRKSPDNFAAFMKLKGEWTGMGGAVDALNRKFHTITRKLFQEAGYNCVGRQETVKIAEEIRRRAIKCLRRPVSYEIWANY